MLPFSIDLNNKVAVVTGGAGILGAAMCRALAACGAKVVIIGRDLAKATALASEIEATGGIAQGMSCNVLDRTALENAAAHIASTFGPCDILINGAGGNHPKGITDQEYLDSADSGSNFFDLDMEGFKFVFDLNLMGTLLPSQVFAKQMLGRPGCSIINISSMSAMKPLTKVAAYSGAKAAVSNFTQWLAVHLGQSGVRVNAIAPGFFITEQNHKLMLQEDGNYTPRAQKVIAQTPMRRFGEADELIGALLWLVEPKASGFVTGSIIAVDGGFSAYAGV
ncbi:SDR family oxidoreductase [Uliginosibacterium sp. 31-16]|uniref:SDR family oxidoreductase n=1 Tax=Uliginosibacterium sp. 31-16 TaxID=3068315 RepID=UPI00273DDDE9|nr:SDR family oxidoreductase [Uliginosibacterium sp. 31-16]MDP5239780.1 SDR family oxidoreductase [Uliginosibacterium sp. 31-16]